MGTEPSGSSADPSATPIAATGMRSLLLRLVGRGRYAAIVRTYRLARAREELRSPYPLRAKLAAWRLGFRAENAALYDLGRNNAHAYITDYQRNHRCVRINRVPDLLDNKLFLKVLLAARGHAQAEAIALIDRDYVLLRPLDAVARPGTPAELERLMAEDGGRFICKPIGGTRGADVFLVRSRDGALERQRGKNFTPFRVASLTVPTLVERVVEQGEFWESVCPASFNTMRVVTMWTPGEEAPFVGAAVQRFGTYATAPTDNWSGGGICARIDLAAGMLGIGRMHPAKSARSETEYTHHPDTQARIEGAIVPHWERVKQEVLRAAETVLANRYVGWDVIVDRAGTPVIIEGNKNTDVNLLQVHGGLLEDPAVRRFYAHTGVL